MWKLHLCSPGIFGKIYIIYVIVKSKFQTIYLNFIIILVNLFYFSLLYKDLQLNFENKCVIKTLEHFTPSCDESQKRHYFCSNFREISTRQLQFFTDTVCTIFWANTLIIIGHETMWFITCIIQYVCTVPKYTGWFKSNNGFWTVLHNIFQIWIKYQIFIANANVINWFRKTIVQFGSPCKYVYV